MEGKRSERELMELAQCIRDMLLPLTDEQRHQVLSGIDFC